MTLQDLENELNKIKKIIPEVEKYSGQTVSILPIDIKNNLQQIETLPAMTSAGFEKIDTILKKLYISKDVIEERLKTNQEQTIPIQTKPIIDIKPKIQVISPQPQRPITIKPPTPDGPQPKSKFTKSTADLDKTA